MNNQQRIEILTSYQDNPMVHPLTCGNNSLHNLVPIEENKKVILKCLECDYTQLLDDKFIKLLRDLDKVQREMIEWFKNKVKELNNENTINS
jgi:predicted nucleic-acid-binding Zn-ribbon protein